MAETSDLTRSVSNDLKNCGYNVATNKRNTLNLPQFHTKGVGNSVPDLFFWDAAYEDEIFDPNFNPQRYNHIRAGFVELKPGDHLRQMIEAIFQNTRYYRYFITNKAIMRINGKQIHNVDGFYLCSNWSRTGRIYKGDDYLPSLAVQYISDRYNMLVPPYTRMIHSVQRFTQKQVRYDIKMEKLNIPNNKIYAQTGILVSKIPQNEEHRISYEYYAWMGNKVIPVVAKHKFNPEYIDTQLKIHGITDQALIAETKLGIIEYFSKDQIILVEDIKKIKIGNWYNVRIALWLYSKKRKIFGIT